MTDFNALRQEINTTVYENQDGDITGSAMNEILNDVVDAVEEATSQSFKGWWPNLASLKNAVTATPGDSAYVKDADPATTWSIYIYDPTASANGYWVDSGTDADTSNVQTFETGEHVNAVSIVNDHTTGGAHDVLSAEQGKIIGDEVFGTDNGQYVTMQSGVNHYTGKYYNGGSSLIAAGEPAGNLSGCVAYKVLNVQGRRFKVFGKGNTASVPLIIWADANRYIISVVSGNYLSSGYIAVPPEGAAIMAGNFMDYNSATCYVQEWNSEHEDGLVDRVRDLEDNMPSQVQVVDSLESSSTTNALSANQGKVLNDKINGSYEYAAITPHTVQDRYQNGTSASITGNDGLLGTLAGTLYNRVDDVQGRLFRVYGKGTSDAVPLVIWADSSRNILSVVKGTYRTTPYIATPPNNAYYMVVNMMDYSSSTDKIEEYQMVESGLVQEIEAKQAEIDLSLPLKGKKVMFFGDSISYFSGMTGNIPANFAEVSKASCYSAAVGGTRLVPRRAMVQSPTTQEQAYAALEIPNMVAAWAAGDYTYQQAAVNYLNDHSYAYNYQSRITNMTNRPIASAEIVIIGGGTNDFSVSSPMGSDTDTTTATVKGAIANIVTTLLSANPKLKIYFWTPIVGRHKSGSTWVWDDTYTNNNNMTKPQFIDAITQAAKLRHVPMIDMYWALGWNETNFNEYFYADQVNPNNPDYTHPFKGFDVIARRLYGEVKALME